MKPSQIRLETKDKVGVITLDHPPRNALSKTMIHELLAALEQYELDPDIRAVLVKSDDSHFSQGRDTLELKEALDDLRQTQRELAELGGQLVERLDLYSKPTVAAARGICTGGAAAFYCAFDIRVAGETLNLREGSIYYGSIENWGMSTLRLPLWIGRNKALDYIFLAEGFTGRQAYELGLVSKVVPDDSVNEMGLIIAQKLATAAPIAVRYFKECLRQSVYHQLDLKQLREQELASAEAVYASLDFQNGMQAFAAGQDVDYQGE